MSSQPDCIFCRIVKGEIPAARLIETDDALAFLDVGPLNPGHCLLIPKAHYPGLPDLPDELAAEASALLPRLCRAVQTATGAEGLNIVVNNGRVAGQSVSHVHWHIIPRHAGDALHWPWPAGQYDEGALTAMQTAILERLGEEH